MTKNQLLELTNNTHSSQHSKHVRADAIQQSQQKMGFHTSGHWVSQR